MKLLIIALPTKYNETGLVKDILGHLKSNNIADNAVRYTPDGGQVHISAGKKKGRTFYRVEDNGIGIPKAEQGRIFERFYRVDKSHSKEIGGTGLGLSIVKHGVKTLNGRLWLNSEPGQGTEIIMEFPKHHMEKEAAE